jgi:uncharacterized protein (DUF58 family)
MQVMPRPGLVPYLKLVRGRTRLPPVGSTTTKVGISTIDFRDVRQYAHGDPFKAINWKATARRLAAGRTSPLTNQYESEGRRVVWLLADASPHMTVGDTYRNPLEVSVHLAAGAARYFLKRDYQVGLMAYGGTIGTVQPDIGRKQLFRISRALASVGPGRGTATLAGAVQELRHSLRVDWPLCMVFTRLDHPDQEALLAKMRKLCQTTPGGRALSPPIVVGVSGYHLVKPGDAYGRNSQLLLDLATRSVVRDIDALGARVVEWRPEETVEWAGVAAAGGNGHER